MAGFTTASVIYRAFQIWPDDPGRVLFRSQEAIHYLNEIMSSPILDIGCGNGQFASLINVVPSVGIDKNKSLLKQASRLGTYQSLVCGSVTELPFHDALFSTVIANSTLEHVTDIQLAVREVCRVMRSGGRLLMTIPLTTKREWLGLPNEEFGPVDSDLQEEYRTRYDHRWNHRHYFDKPGIRSILHSGGFTGTSITEYERQEVANLIDALSFLRVRPKRPLRSELESYMGDRMRVFWANLMANVLAYNSKEEGAFAFCVATKG